MNKNTQTPDMKTKDYRDVAVKILTQGIAGGDTEYLKSVIAESYVQHNPRVPDGRDGLVGMVEHLKASGALLDIEPVRVIKDGDIVAIHGRHIGESESVAFDLFRFDSGLAVEHWDGIQEALINKVSGRSMTDGHTEITDLEKTEENRLLVTSFYTDVLINGKVEKITEYLGDVYLQHNPNIADGVDGLMAFFTYLKENNIPFSLHKLHRSIAEGNFVVLQSEGEIAGKPNAFYDLFRVDNGKIVEHWDVVQEIPAEMAHNNGMF